jgi:hypothetical protein
MVMNFIKRSTVTLFLWSAAIAQQDDGVVVSGSIKFLELLHTCVSLLVSRDSSSSILRSAHVLLTLLSSVVSLLVFHRRPMDLVTRKIGNLLLAVHHLWYVTD